MKLFLFYTDPGSGAMLLQVLLAFVAGGVFYFRNFIRSLFSWGRKGDTKIDANSHQVDDAETKA